MEIFPGRIGENNVAAFGTGQRNHSEKEKPC
jgi:hypothetical protein